MTSEEAKAITKAGEMVLKGINDGFRALNVNLVDAANSLRKIAEAGIQATDDYWHLIFGPESVDLPGPEYDWVLVKIRDIGSSEKPYGVPHIAELRKDGKWWPLEWDEPYGSDQVPFEVVFWRPIPGDCCTTLFAGGQAVRRDHTYE